MVWKNLHQRFVYGSWLLYQLSDAELHSRNNTKIFLKWVRAIAYFLVCQADYKIMYVCMLSECRQKWNSKGKKFNGRWKQNCSVFDISGWLLSVLNPIYRAFKFRSNGNLILILRVNQRRYHSHDIDKRLIGAC